MASEGHKGKCMYRKRRSHRAVGAMILAALIVLVTLVQNRVYGFGRPER